MFGQYAPGQGYPGGSGLGAVVYTLLCNAGSYAITGSAATFRRALRLSTSIGSYAITGSAATLKASYKLATAIGSYAITGSAATFRRGLRLVTAPGSYVLTGSAAAFRRALRLTTSVGSYVLTGSAASIRHIYPSTCLVYINGVDRTDDTLKKDAEIEDILNDIPNTAKVVVRGGTKPVEGNRLAIYRGFPRVTEFAGTIVNVEQVYETHGTDPIIDWVCSAQDRTWRFNEGDPITYRWTGSVAVSTIATAIIGSTAGFTASIEGGLGNLTDFEVISFTPSEALKKLCEEVGGISFRIDYDDVVNVFTEDTDTPPDTITAATLTDTSAPIGTTFSYGGNIAQVGNRCIGKGKTATVSAGVGLSSSTLPLEDATQFSVAGGKAIIGPNIVDYTSKSTLDGQGSTVAGPQGSPGGVTPAVSTTESGGALGAYKYWKTEVDANGEESEPSAVSSTVNPATVGTPSAIGSGATQHTAANTGGITRSGTSFTFPLSGVVAGALVLFQSNSGAFDGVWRVISASGGTCTFNGISSSAPSSDTAVGYAVTLGPHDINFKEYGVSFLSALGETAISASLSVQGAGVSFNPSGTSTTSGAGGVLGSGNWIWFITATLHGGGETSPIVWTSVNFTSGTTNKLTITLNSGLLNDRRISGLKLYRSKAGLSTPWLLASNTDRDTIHASGWTYVDDHTSDSQLGALPQSGGPTGAAIGLSSITTTSDARCTGRRLWRKVSGTWYPLATISDRDTTTTYLDTTSDADLIAGGAQGLAQTGFGGAAINLTFTAIAAGKKANIYRSKNGGSQGFHCGSVDAGVSTFKDKKADEDLGREMVAYSQRVTPAGATSIRVKDIAKFLSSGGWARAGNQVFKFAGKTGSTGEGVLTGIPGSVAISGIVRSGTTATVTTSSAHGFVTGQRVRQAGANQSDYNGDFLITVTSSTTYTFTVSASATTPATGTILAYGPGAITAPIRYDSEIVNEPHLTGITTGGSASIQWAINKGDRARLYTVRNDAAAQATLLAAEGEGTGIRTGHIDDESLDSVTALDAACDAFLENWANKQNSIKFDTFSTKVQSGKVQSVNLPGDPHNCVGDFLIQRVVSRELDSVPGQMPRRSVTAEPIHLTYQDITKRRARKGVERAL